MVSHIVQNYPDPTNVRETNADSAYLKLLANTMEHGQYVGYGNNVGSGNTVELRPTKITYPGTKKYITVREKFNLAFALVEVLWILQGREDVEMLSFYNKQISTYSDDGEKFNAPYGYRIFKRFGDQFKMAYDKLVDNPHSRHAVLNIWDPVADNESGHKDYACNNLSQILIRSGKLEWTQIMRSNDLLWGLPYNTVQFGSLMQIMASLLRVDIGGYTHISNSSHIYTNMVDEAEKLLLNNTPVFYDSPPLVCESYSEMVEMVKEYSKVEEYLRKDPKYKINLDLLCNNVGWKNLMGTIAVYSKIKHGDLEWAPWYLEFITPNSYERIWSEAKLNKALEKNVE